MKALVLCGGLPQIALIKELKARGVTTILADMNEKVKAREYADKFCCVSVLDVDAVRAVAIEEKVDFLITVCADQVLQVVAQIAEELGLPWYIDYQTAENVSKKSYMKRIFWENGVPTTKFVILDKFDAESIAHLSYPIIVKPSSSADYWKFPFDGMKKVYTADDPAEAEKIINEIYGAGYPDKMEGFLSKNPGLRSRIAFHVPFADYDSSELCQIADMISRKNGMKLEREALDKLEKAFDVARACGDFGNGRYVRNVFEQAKMNQASRLLEKDFDSITTEDVTTITAEDIVIPEASSPSKRRIGFC